VCLLAVVLLAPCGVPRELESSRVLASAPLIFFFYSYGVRSSAAESVDRKLYWYAVTHNRRPYDSRRILTPLLRRWGIE
jgi:hypothetical protein